MVHIWFYLKSYVFREDNYMIEINFEEIESRKNKYLNCTERMSIESFFIQTKFNIC